MEWLQSIKKWLHKDKKNKYMLIIGLVGIIVLMIGSNIPKNEQPKETNFNEAVQAPKDDTPEIDEADIITLEKNYEQTLQEMLNKMNGISHAEVMMNIGSTNVQVYEKDQITQKQQTEEQDTNGGVRHVEDESKETKLVSVREGEKEVPLLSQLQKPEVRGVLIIADGVESASKKKEVIDAVAKVLDIPTYPISITEK